MKFKLGQKVKVIENESGSCNKVGDEGTIVEISKNDIKVLVEGRAPFGNYHIEEDLQLIE